MWNVCYQWNINWNGKKRKSLFTPLQVHLIIHYDETIKSCWYFYVLYTINKLLLKTKAFKLPRSDCALQKTQKNLPLRCLTEKSKRTNFVRARRMFASAKTGSNQIRLTFPHLLQTCLWSESNLIHTVKDKTRHQRYSGEVHLCHQGGFACHDEVHLSLHYRENVCPCDLPTLTRIWPPRQYWDMLNQTSWWYIAEVAEFSCVFLYLFSCINLPPNDNHASLLRNGFDSTIMAGVLIIPKNINHVYNRCWLLVIRWTSYVRTNFHPLYCFQCGLTLMLLLHLD